MEELKYIIVNRFEAVVFDAGIEHKTVAGNQKIMSAGFTKKDYSGRFYCYHESISLGIKSRPKEDAKIINAMFGIEI